MKTLAAFVALLVVQASQVSPFEGDWRTDVPAWIKYSSGGGAPSGISFAVTRDQVKITERMVTPGSDIVGEEVLRTDDKPHPSANGPGWAIVAKWSTPNLLDVVDTGIGVNTVTVHRTYSVSADQKTLTVRFVYSWNGYIDEHVFYR